MDRSPRARLLRRPRCVTAVAIAMLTAAVPARADRDVLPQKIRFLDQMIERAHADGPALDEARRLRSQAEDAMNAGQRAEADQLLTAGLRVLASQNLAAGPSAAVVEAESRRRYGELAEGVGVYREALGEAMRLKGGNLSSVVDIPKVERLAAEARRLAEAGKHRQALGPLLEAHGTLEAAVVRLRSNDTVVYSRVFRTLQDELRFEMTRLDGNRALIARALTAQLPAPQRARLLAAEVEAAKLADAAQAQAKAGDVKAAVRSVEQANGKILDVVMELSRE